MPLHIQQPTCINDVSFEAKSVLQSGGSAVFTAREIGSMRMIEVHFTKVRLNNEESLKWNKEVHRKRWTL